MTETAQVEFRNGRWKPLALGPKVSFERALNQGVGGPRMVLETTKVLKTANEEVVISYDHVADNRELMLRYGFSLEANRNDRIQRPPAPAGGLLRTSSRPTLKRQIESARLYEY